MIVQFINRQNRYKITPWRHLIRQVLPAAFEAGSHEPALADDIAVLISVTFAGPCVMRRINRESRQIDQLTDVLSFPLLNMKEGRLSGALTAADFDWSHMPRRVLPLGDLILSLDRADEQAESFGHTIRREIAFLTVHGCLHLLGYDHQTPTEDTVMTSIQENVLRQLGLTREIGGSHE